MQPEPKCQNEEQFRELLKERNAMDLQENQTSRQTILRLPAVLQRTGLSRSTLYNRIAEGEFPHQISLGGHAIGWIQGEVDDWIDKRINLRPQSSEEILEGLFKAGNAIPPGIQNKPKESRRYVERTSCTVSVDEGSPDPTNLHLVGTKVYFDRSTDSFWLKLVAEDSTCNGRRPRMQDRRGGVELQRLLEDGS